MKTFKIISTAGFLMLCIILYSQDNPNGGGKKNVYVVQTSHTPEQCLNALTGFKDKGEELLSKFEFGCMSGDHTGYAFLEGKSESEIKQMLPKESQSNAKIRKVDKFTGDQIEKIHKDKMNSGAKK